MRCLVCHKEFMQNDCPVCRFPIVNFPGDREAGIHSLMPDIKAHRVAFSPRVQIDMVIYHCTIENGEITERSEELIPLGTAETLQQGLVWLDRTFDVLTDNREVAVQLIVEVDGTCYDRTVRVPVVPGAKTQEIGITLNDDFQFCVHVRSISGDIRTSEQFYLFE